MPTCFSYIGMHMSYCVIYMHVHIHKAAIEITLAGQLYFCSDIHSYYVYVQICVM